MGRNGKWNGEMGSTVDPSTSLRGVKSPCPMSIEECQDRWQFQEYTPVTNNILGTIHLFFISLRCGTRAARLNPALKRSRPRAFRIPSDVDRLS